MNNPIPLFQQSAIPKEIGALMQPGFAMPRLPAQGQQELIYLLQTTLDVEELLRIFSTILDKSVVCDGLSYRMNDAEISLDQGAKALHSASYHLRIEQEDLGEITFYRRKRFQVTELESVENTLSYLAYPLRNALRYLDALRSALTDPLTHAPNRMALESTLHREVEFSQRNKTPLSMVVLDIDHFKRINDRFGHQAGDQVLKAVAQRAQEKIRTCDYLFRYGGEEFVILLSSTDLEEARSISERVRAGIAKLNHGEQPELQVTASFGVATMKPTESARDLFRRADQAMYQAKANGRNRIEAAP